jgi:hypothetical protein
MVYVIKIMAITKLTMKVTNLNILALIFEIARCIGDKYTFVQYNHMIDLDLIK